MFREVLVIIIHLTIPSSWLLDSVCKLLLYFGVKTMIVHLNYTSDICHISCKLISSLAQEGE